MSDETEAETGLEETGVEINAATPENEETNETNNEQNSDDTGDHPAEKEESETRTQKRRRKRKERDASLAQDVEDAQNRADEAERRLAAIKPPSQELLDSDPDKYVAENTANAARRGVIEESIVTAKAEQDAAKQRSNVANQEIWEEASTDARARYKDYDEKVNNPDLKVTQEMYSAALATDNPADVAYYLGSNPIEASEITRLNRTEQIMAITRISLGLAPPTQNRRTNAPAPIKPISGGGAATTKSPDKMSYSEYRTFRGMNPNGPGYKDK